MMIDLLYILCCIAIVARLIMFNRGGCHYKLHISFIAWLLVASTGALAIALITGITHAQQLPGLLSTVLLVLAVLVFRSGGNVAHLFTPIRIQQWTSSSVRATAARK